MSILNTVADCIARSFYPCVQIEPQLDGTRTRGGLPAITCPVSPGPLSLPQDDRCAGKPLREVSRAVSQCVFGFRHAPGFDMPVSQTFGAYLAAPMTQAIGQAQAQYTALHNEDEAIAANGDLARFNSFREFREMFIEYKVPPIAECWREDRVWTDQLLAGFDPITIQRVTSDGDVGANWKTLSAKLNRGVIVAIARAFDENPGAAIEAGRLFVCDYAELKDAGPTWTAVGAQSGQVPMAPIALLMRAKTHGGLDPIAIQLDQTPDSAFHVPGDGSDWMVARSYAQAASYQLTQCVYHLTLHHLIEEAFAVTTMRQIPQCHPLWPLLGHHFAGLMPINTGTLTQFFGEATERFLLVGREASERMVNARYARWRFRQLDFAADLKRRGVDDRELLPYYPHRDDLMLYWDLLRDYTYEYLALYYGDPRDPACDADRNVAEDFELQAWAAELSRRDGGAGNVPGFPGRITRFSTLHDIVHLLIFTAGPHHASLNFSQLDYATWVPNMPAATYLLPPAAGADRSTLLNLMPPASESIGQMTMSHQAQYYMGQLLDYSGYFCGCWNEPARNLVARYRRELTGPVSHTLRVRNRRRLEDGSLPYPYVLPVNVPNSISS
jgi:arachidonate 15-lipoxygenase